MGDGRAGDEYKVPSNFEVCHSKLAPCASRLKTINKQYTGFCLDIPSIDLHANGYAHTIIQGKPNSKIECNTKITLCAFSVLLGFIG